VAVLERNQPALIDIFGANPRGLLLRIVGWHREQKHSSNKTSLVEVGPRLTWQSEQRGVDVRS